MNLDSAYCLYVSLKSHFNSLGYDFFKYGGRINVSIDSFDARRDKPFFIKVSKTLKKTEYVCLLLANFIYDPNIWIGDILSDCGNKRLQDWKKTIESLVYTFKQDLCYIEDYILQNDLKFQDLFEASKPYPEIVKMCIEKRISLETFCILNDILNFVDYVDVKIDERILWEKYKMLAIKYAPFLLKNRKPKYTKIFIEKFNIKNLTYDIKNYTIYTNTDIGDL